MIENVPMFLLAVVCILALPMSTLVYVIVSALRKGAK